MSNAFIQILSDSLYYTKSSQDLVHNVLDLDLYILLEFIFVLDVVYVGCKVVAQGGL